MAASSTNTETAVTVNLLDCMRCQVQLVRCDVPLRNERERQEGDDKELLPPPSPLSTHGQHQPQVRAEVEYFSDPMTGEPRNVLENETYVEVPRPETLVEWSVDPRFMQQLLSASLTPLSPSP